MSKNFKPKVSVAVAAYNHQMWIKDCLHSILRQTFEDLEVIVIDDDSSDATFEIACSVNDPRITVQKNEGNQGVSVAANAAIKAASGEYVALIGSDDKWHPDKIALQVDWLDRHREFDVCFTGSETIDESDLLSPQQVVFDTKNRSRLLWLARMLVGNCHCAPSVLIRRSALAKIGYFAPSLHQLQDYDLWLRFLCSGHQLHVLEEPLVQYRVCGTRDSISNSASPEKTIRDVWEGVQVLENYRRLSLGELRDLSGLWGGWLEHESMFLKTRSVDVGLALLCSRIASLSHHHFAADLLTRARNALPESIGNREFLAFIGGLNLFRVRG